MADGIQRDAEGAANRLPSPKPNGNVRITGHVQPVTERGRQAHSARGSAGNKAGCPALSYRPGNGGALHGGDTVGKAHRYEVKKRPAGMPWTVCRCCNHVAG